MLLKKHAPQFAPRKTIKPVKIYKPKPKPKKKIKVKKPSIQYAANVASQIYPRSQTQSWGSNNPASENYIEDVSNVINPPAPTPAPNVVNPVSNVQSNSNNNTTIIIAGAALAGVALVMMGKKGK